MLWIKNVIKKSPTNYDYVLEWRHRFVPQDFIDSEGFY